MVKGSLTKCVVFLTALLILGAEAYSQQDGYPDAPRLLLDAVNKVAKDIVSSKNVNRLGSALNSIFFYTVADSLAPENKDVPIRTIEAYQYLGETARTDKHMGASAKSSGSTSILEKPGFAQLLGYAIEHGAIQQKIASTALTLSTSPYAIFAMVNGDTAQSYEKAGFLKRIGTSATFNISNQNNVLENVDWNQLSEWAIQFRLVGDRSTRSKKFQEFWASEIKPKIQRRLNVISGAQSLIGEDKNLEKIRRKMSDPSSDDDPKLKEQSLRDKIQEYLSESKDETSAKQISDIEELILRHMKKFLFDPIRKNEIIISHQTRVVINTQAIPSLAEAHRELEQARQLLDRYLTEFNKGPLLTLAFTDHRRINESDYSDIKLLYEQDVRPLKVVSNVWIAFYHDPDPSINQERIRDFGLAVSFEGKANNPFAVSAADMSKITYSFSGRYQRMGENKGVSERTPDIVVAQFKLDLPITLGISLPFSFSYASSTEQNKENEMRFSFGVNFDVDKLYALTRKILRPSNN